MECNTIFILFLILIIYIKIINLNNFDTGLNRMLFYLLFTRKKTYTLMYLFCLYTVPYNAYYINNYNITL